MVDIHFVTKLSFLEGASSIGMNFVNDIGSRGLRLKTVLIEVRLVVGLLMPTIFDHQLPTAWMLVKT